MISFVVPAYNEEAELSSTLAAIRAAASGVSQPFEIIVVDDASTDATPEIAEQAGARVVSIHRRQIAAARNAGARAAQGEYLFFVDADTRINRDHVTEAIAALEAGYSGGSARGVMDGFIPFWSRILLRVFCTVYFGLNLGAGAFLFTTRRNFEATGGFDEQYFAGEEVYFSLALRETWPFQGAAGTCCHIWPEVAHVSSQRNSWHTLYYDPRRAPHGAVARETASLVRWQTRKQMRHTNDTDAAARGFSAWVAKMRSSSRLAPSLWQRATKRRLSRSSSCMRKIPAARMCRSHFLPAGSSI